MRIRSLTPLSELPDKLQPFARVVTQIQIDGKSATGFYFQGNLMVSVEHIAKGCAIGTEFSLDRGLCEIVWKGTNNGDSDCAFFKLEEEPTEAVEEFCPLTEDSVLLVMNAQGELLWRNISVHVKSATFGECTAPGYSGAVILSLCFDGKWRVSGMHIGEGRILRGEELLPYLKNIQDTKVLPLHNVFPHTEGNYSLQTKNGPGPEQVHSKKRPDTKVLKKEEKVFFGALEKIGFFSDHSLYGTNIEKGSVVGRHFAYSKKHADQIAAKEFKERNKKRDILTILDCTSVIWEKFSGYIEAQRKADPKFKKAGTLLHVDPKALGIGRVWVYTYHCNNGNNGNITCETKKTAEQEELEVETLFLKGFSLKEKRKYGYQLFMNHFVVS